MRRSRASLLLLGLPGVVLGCSGSTDTSLTTAEDTAVQTSVTVLPTSFLGSVPCSNIPGAMQSYVATLTDTTDSEHPFQLPSSLPTPCSQPIAFRWVVAGRQYSTAIDGYDFPASALVPRDGPSSGSRIMKSNGNIASPRWTTACSPVISDTVTNVNVTECAPLDDHGGLGLTGIEVGIAGALGLLACAPGGTIARFDVHPADPSLVPFLGVACDGGVVSYTIGIKEDVNYTFSVDAYSMDTSNDAGPPRVYATTCSAKAKKGLTVPALCEPLSLKP
jgi:hypothetical protein